MAFQEFELNMIPHGDMPTFYASQYETGRPIIIDIMMGEDAFDCSELYIELHARKVDDNIVTLEPDSVDGNQVTFVGTDQLFACPGKNLCEVCLYADETKDTSLGSLNFFIEVESDPLAGGLTSETQIYDLYQQVEEITQQVIGDDYYDKTEVDDLLDDKADKSDTYTKSQVDTALNLKADKATTYTKTQVDNALNLKADKSDTYTKTQVDSALALKANTADLATVATTGDYDDLINKPTIPAAQVQSDWSQADNTQVDYIKNKPDINAMIANALFAVMPVATEGPAATCTFVTEIAAPLQSVLAEVVATQAAGTPTPLSPLPITGYSSANITRCGINAFDEVMELGDINASGVYINSTTTLRSKNHFPVKASTSYYVTFNTDDGAKMYIAQYDKDLNFISWVPSNQGITVPRSITTASNCCYIAICFTSAYGTAYKNDVSFNYPSTDTTYHAYNGQTYAIAFGQTVYGGVLDVTRGKLTVTHANIASYNGESINEPWLSSMDTYVPNTTPTTGAQVVYPLTTPFDIDLTPVQINALLGVNNVFNDTNGDTEVQYKDSIQHYIDSRV